MRSVKIIFPQNCSISSYPTVAEANGLHHNFRLNKGMNNDLGCVISAKHGLSNYARYFAVMLGEIEGNKQAVSAGDPTSH